MLYSLYIATCVFLIGFSTAKQLPLSKPGQAVKPVKNTPWIHVFYTPVLQPKGSSSCLDASGKIILTKTFASPCSSFSSADSPDGKASHIWNEKLEPCGFEDKVFKCGKGVENANFTYEGDYYVPILLVDRSKGPYDQNLRSKQNFTTIANWRPDPIVLGDEGDYVALWWGNY
ncbi:hypothetical protein GLAREA_04310 [Glarea lozoyensis ATCC 20868]|uniref:Uncharacterized protein n=1 Tax=Glarea lozoyensis (strain ATCC 20868 / MF5171) TaxID=1116229 RepID=S3CQX7_GLAL2|nr:uncharacterized protein GLAREA_04310 [Glarea lozoyensis ATCC 20868]EPE27519.1 hypothetical protein GLAREA_04310 [Glarea lozoyensis ATCC 20868]